MSRDEDVLQQPEDVRFTVPVFHTSNACCGAVTAYLLRRIAYVAGAYAPGIQEHVFHELNTSQHGGTIEKVQRWFGARVALMHQLGYRLQSRRIALPTPTLIEWVKAGKGYRGAMLPTDYGKIHPEPGAAGADVLGAMVAHAVGLTMERGEGNKTAEQLVMIDPWPGVVGDAKDHGPVHSELEAAHRAQQYFALVYYWVGWS